MLKQYTIGRGEDCQIRLQDNSQRISRSHATLKILDNGKIFITDHSSNGTFVNGVKISQNIDYPIKRGDSISFAHAADLNWDLIPKKNKKNLLFTMIALIIIGIAMACYFIWCQPFQPPVNKNTVNKADSIEFLRIEKIRADSIRASKLANDSAAAKKMVTPKVQKKVPEKKAVEAKKAALPDSTKKEEKKNSPIFIN